MAHLEEIYDSPEEHTRGVRYSRTREWLALVDLIFGSVTSLLALSTGLSARLRTEASRLAPKRLGPPMLYAVAGIALSSLAELPLSYFRGFVVEHRYGLSNQTRLQWFTEELKGTGVALILGLPLIQGAYWVIRRYPRTWWAVLSGLTIPFTILLANLAPVLLAPLFNKYVPVKDKTLAERIKRLAAGQGVKVSEVLQMDMSKQTKKANAFFTGIGNTKRIVLGDTLLDEFTPDEIEVVLAHELGHQVHRDLWKMIAMQIPLSLATFFTAHALSRPAMQRFGGRWGLNQEEGAGDVAAMPLLTLLGGIASLALTPLVNAISRNWMEHRADRYALDLTGKKEAFVSAMKKLGRMNLADPKPPALVKYLLYSHPPLAERIDFGRSYTPPGGRDRR